MFTCIPLDHLPKVPQHFIDRALRLVRESGHDNLCANDYTHSGYLTRDIVLEDGTVTKSRHVESFAMGEDWEQWVRENIIDCYTETGVRTSVGKGIKVHGAHADAPIKWKFFYLVEEGGDNVITTFYKEKGQPLVRFSTPDNIVHSNDYSNLDVVDPVHIPVGMWMLFNTQVIHAVENIMSDRTILVASVRPEDVQFEIRKKVK